MLKNRSLQVKLVEDKEAFQSPRIVGNDHTKQISDISDAVIHVAEEVSKTAAKVVVAYIAMDTWRKVTISVFSRG